MNFIVEYWYLIVAAILIIIGGVIAAINFFSANRNEQISKLKEWLLYATTLAEKELGSGTGKLKLRFVYDMFATKFPWLVKIISFDRFSSLVDEVLDEMNKLLSTNTAVKAYVDGATEVEFDIEVESEAVDI